MGGDKKYFPIQILNKEFYIPLYVHPDYFSMTWEQCLEEVESEGKRLPTLNELKYLYDVHNELKIGKIPRANFWSSDPYESGMGLYPRKWFFSFRHGRPDWEYANSKIGLLIKVKDL
jgi:hypothetical protein